VQGARRVETDPFDGDGSFEAELPYVLRTLRRHGVSERDAEDLAQDVFLVMWRRRADFDPGRPLRSWLAGIAFKVAHEHHKRSRRFWPREELDPRDERPLPDEQVASARARRLVLGALGRLSERQRAILVMHDLDGLAMPEIVALLRVPLFTGYSRLRLARKSFARAVDKLRRLPEAATAAELLETERPVPALAPEVRERAVSRVRAVLAGTLPRRPAPAPRRWPWLAAGLAVLLAAGVVATRSARMPAPAAPRAAPASLGRGLIGYWRFDEGAGAIAHDRSGSGNDCQLRPGGGWTGGVLGGALALDGRAWLDCPRVEPLARLDRELSIAVWVKPDAGGAGRQVFVARQLGAGREDYFLLALNGDTLEAQSNLWESATKRRVNRPSGAWFHVAVVQKADGRRTLYLDGVPIGRSNKSRPAALGGGTSRLTIGGAVNGPDPGVADERFSGALDELAIYARALDESEVRALAGRAQPQ
jgi:RNA polymerase sigma-70 factor (ECF subfamily)